MKKITQLLGLTLVAMLALVGCKKQHAVYENDGSDIIPFLNTETRLVELWNISNGEYIELNDSGIVAMSQMHEGLFLANTVVDGRLRYYYINEDGERQFGEYASASIFSDGIAWVAEPQNHLKAMDREGNILFEFPEAQRAMAFVAGTSIYYTVAGEVGVVNDKGKVVIEPSLGVALDRLSDRVLTSVRGQLYLLNRDFKSWNDGMMFDSTINQVITNAIEYKEILDWTNIEYVNHQLTEKMNEGQMIVVTEDSLWGVMNEQGEYVIEPKFRMMIPDEDKYLVKLDSVMWGWCDATGKMIIKKHFEGARLFNGNDLAPVKVDGLWGYADQNGKIRIKPQYVEAYSFNDGDNAVVIDKKTNHRGLIDSRGKWVMMPEYDDLYLIPGKNKYMVEKSYGYACRQSNGKYIMPFIGRVIDDDMMNDFLGLTTYAMASSDYIDMHTIANALKMVVDDQQIITAKQLAHKADISETELDRRNGQDIVMKEFTMSDSLLVTLTATQVNVRASVYTGWYYSPYQMLYVSSCPIKNFRYDIQVRGRIAERYQDFLNALRESGIEFEYTNENYIIINVKR